MFFFLVIAFAANVAFWLLSLRGGLQSETKDYFVLAAVFGSVSFIVLLSWLLNVRGSVDFENQARERQLWTAACYFVVFMTWFPWLGELP